MAKGKHGTNAPVFSGAKVVVDAGMERTRWRCFDAESRIAQDVSIPSHDLRRRIRELRTLSNADGEGHRRRDLLITGNLAPVVRDLAGTGLIILPAAALWAAAEALVRNKGQTAPLAIIDLSASGYIVIGVDAQGRLEDDLLIANPRCGAGSGANIDRILQKLAIERNQVDELLADFLGEKGAKKRAALEVRADRCGVFSSSATISDKNQGIPLDYALAVTLKSEVKKVCGKLPAGFRTVYLRGGVFEWQFTRDCARDALADLHVEQVEYDADQSLMIEGVRQLATKVNLDSGSQSQVPIQPKGKPEEYPGFADLRADLAAGHRYCRMAPLITGERVPENLEEIPVLIGLDVGSTMAKLMVARADNQKILVVRSQGNEGDTIETIKRIFRDLCAQGINHLRIDQIGITGSARYQVQEALRQIYPQLGDRLTVLVENYAHAYGSLDFAREYMVGLEKEDVEDINRDHLILVDIGGEDTKISTISLREGELFDNAMNLKCSAGTGSLMDTLRHLFRIETVEEVSRRAFAAPKGYAINATCAVLLMENARKLQVQGIAEDEILASAAWAVVENMARTLWSQLELPKNALVLLHGQTMLSDPLPLAVIRRMQELSGSPCYGLVPPHPGHMACLGLIKTMAKTPNSKAVLCDLDEFIDRVFKKKIIHCHGAACGDRNACCSRTSLSGTDSSGKRFHFSLGGCTAINEFLMKKDLGIKPSADAYQEIWKFVDERLPRSDDENRLVIPRSFAVSEWAYFFSRIFQHLSLPVHVDNVRDQDIVKGQPVVNVDTCAPQLGAVGQYRRLSEEPHGMILAPQIEYLPVAGASRGRTCTVNQGGVIVAKNLAELHSPKARFHSFTIDLHTLDARTIASQIYSRLTPVFLRYGIRPTMSEFEEKVARALDDQKRLKAELADKAADTLEDALAAGEQVAVVAGREYILNPGIYDSHVGRLLRDKRVVAIPAYTLDIKPDPQFKHIYWRNPHYIVSLLSAIANRRLHERLTHPRLREIFRRLETDTDDRLLPVVQVSTFACGPDSMTAPLIAEIMKNRPFLVIQSDAVIKELAHLENRVNTYLKQIGMNPEAGLLQASDGPFEIRVLEDFRDSSGIDKKSDVIYFPTLSDNRSVTAVMRAGGFTCLDNYDDDSYDVSKLVKLGRKYTGDAVCAPMAAVFADILRAIEDFKRRKAAGDPVVEGKHRVLVFSNKGTGPCRQGQYADMHQLFTWRALGSGARAATSAQRPGYPEDTLLQLLVGEEREAYNFGVSEWIALRVFQGLVLQGVLHSILFEGVSRCSDYGEYRKYLLAFRELKNKLYGIQERDLRPDERFFSLVGTLGEKPVIGIPVKYFVYRLYARDLERAIRRFRERWIDARPGIAGSAVKVFVEGECYMRTAQSEKIFELLLDNLGFQRFKMEYSPLWVYMTYALEEEVMMCKDRIEVARNRQRDADTRERKALHDRIKAIRNRITRVNLLRHLLRDILAQPLYRAADIPMPETMDEILGMSKKLIPSLRPFGELAPYVGEALKKLKEGVDLFLNVAPEGCMVSSMGSVLTPSIVQAANRSGGSVQQLFTADGEVDEEQLKIALLRVLGPERYYGGQAAG